MSPKPVSLYQNWLESLKQNDRALYDELTTRLTRRANEAAFSFEGAASGFESPEIALETIVREGRPAFFVKENRITKEGSLIEATAKIVVDRLVAAAPAIEPLIPLVGRIDVDNFPGTATYVGTAWLVDKDIVVTNRHVAELIATNNDGAFRFRPGRFGEDLRVSIDYRREFGIADRVTSTVKRVIWIQTDPAGADMALLEVDTRADGTVPVSIPLADSDAAAGTNVAVIGYPARAPEYVVPDQERMDKLYGGHYDVKRVAPGMMGGHSRGWATHDCTTLGGNSGSVVIDIDTGKAVALHFAGLYLVENYAVPASTLRQYLNERPWQGTTRKPADPSFPPKKEGSDGHASVRVQPPAASPVVQMPAAAGQVTFQVPITITISLGAGSVLSANASPAAPVVQKDIETAARELYRDQQSEGVVAAWPGYRIENGDLTDEECLVLTASPDRLDELRESAPASYAGFPVEVRPATVDEQLEATTLQLEAPVTSTAYNDDDRKGLAFSFNWINENMKAVLHVGPERSWTILSEFLEGTQTELISAMYEFHAAHVAKAVEKEMAEGARVELILASQTRDPRSNEIAQGDFDRSETFEQWSSQFGEQFERIFVPQGSQGLVANAYHMKVTVRDKQAIWLSSGNWKRSSQPVIPSSKLNDPRAAGSAGNREWHVVVESDTLAERLRNHIAADYERSLELGGTPESIPAEALVDVPIAALESIEEEAPPAEVLKPLTVHRKLRVKPLLTPDRKGAIYSNAVLDLIRSARKQILFQNQYIRMSGANDGFLKELVDALAEKAKKLTDVRIILRSGGDLTKDLSALKRRGVDVRNQVRVLANTHTKGIIVDGRRVLIGSHNWSSMGVTLNRDASLIFDDSEVAQYYAHAFEIDWERSSKPRLGAGTVTETVLPAEGDEPPPGYVRMTLSQYLEG